MGACVPSRITPFHRVICDFIGLLHHPSASRPERWRANTNIACRVSLVDKNSQLQGVIKQLRRAKPRRRRERATGDVLV